MGERFPGTEVASVTLQWVSEGTKPAGPVRSHLSVWHRTGDRLRQGCQGDHREVHARIGSLFNEPRIFASGVPLQALSTLRFPEPH